MWAAPLASAPPDPSAVPSDVDVSMTDAEYGAVVERAKEYIRAGDAFQIVPARTFSTPTLGADPFDVYRALRVLYTGLRVLSQGGLTTACTRQTTRRPSCSSIGPAGG